MIKNIIFDIGNVILNFDLSVILPKFTENKNEQKFIIQNIINSPEWLGYGLIDTGYITKEDAISIVQDRTNHINDDLIYRFWNKYNEYATVNTEILNLIKSLKNKGYNIYLLSNINLHTFDAIEPSGIFEIVDGYVLSYKEHQIKPYESIYKTLINRYALNVKESLFIDDNIRNIETANKLGILGKKVKPDNYESVIKLLKDYDINF